LAHIFTLLFLVLGPLKIIGSSLRAVRGLCRSDGPAAPRDSVRAIGARGVLAKARPKSLRPAFLAVMVSLLAARAAVADDSAKEFWPEFDVWWRLSPAWRLSMFVPLSRNIETNYREGSLILQADYAWGKTRRLKLRLLDENRSQNVKAVLIRGGFLNGRSLDDQGEEYTERTAFGELHVRTPVKGGILLSHRLRSDLRWLGQDPELSTGGGTG